MKFSTPQIIIIASIVACFSPVLLKFFKKMEITHESFMLTIVTGVGFSYSLVAGLKVLWFTISERYEDYNLPDEYASYMAIGAFVLIASSAYAYYRISLKDLFYKERIKETKENTS